MPTTFYNLYVNGINGRWRPICITIAHTSTTLLLLCVLVLADILMVLMCPGPSLQQPRVQCDYGALSRGCGLTARAMRLGSRLLEDCVEGAESIVWMAGPRLRKELLLVVQLLHLGVVGVLLVRECSRD